MKFFVVILFVLGSVLCLKAQNQVNYWMNGLHAMIKFDDSGAHYEYRSDNNNLWRTTASISDSAGNLLFYTSGYRILNRNFQVMQNGNNLNIGDYADFGYEILAIGDGALIITVPEAEDKYYILHTDINYNNVPDVSGQLWSNNIFYCLVDMSLSNGNGGVVAGQRDISILYDTLTNMGMKAVRHGNGRDWWLLTHEYGSDRYFRFLIDPDGFHGPYEQHTGIIYRNHNARDASPMKFSDDGSLFVQLSADSNCFELYDFDRCTGLLYNYRRINTSALDSLRHQGVCFSPSSRYLYLSDFYKIRQYDLEASDIAASGVVVGVDDGIGNPYPTMFYHIGAAPDKKLYVAGYNGAYSLHRINQPDSAGLACNFVQRALPVDSPSYWAGGIPNVPNYALGALNGSGCDTLTNSSGTLKPVFTFGIYPNPFSDHFQISITGAATKVFIEVYDVLGRKVFTKEVVPFNQFIHQGVDLSAYSAGVYFVTVDLNGTRHTRKVVKH